MTTTLAVIGLCVATLAYVLAPLLRAPRAGSGDASALEDLEAPAGDGQRNQGRGDTERGGG